MYADFFGTHGELISAVKLVTRSMSDFCGSGGFDGADLSLLSDQFGPVSADSNCDLAGEDGVVDMAGV